MRDFTKHQLAYLFEVLLDGEQSSESNKFLDEIAVQINLNKGVFTHHLDEERDEPESGWVSWYDAVFALVKLTDNVRIRNFKNFGRYLLLAMDDVGIREPRQVAYMLGTFSHESLFAPVREAEYLPGDYDSDEKWRRKNLRYYPFYGRGFIQITWKDNYLWAEKAMEEITGEKQDFTSSKQAMDRLLDPAISAYLSVYGMHTGQFGDRLDKHVNSKKADYLNARRSVNLMDKAALIARYAKAYERVLIG